jgi:aubergine-like protein
MIILPMAKDDLYAAVKRQCLVETSMPSQVILAKTLAKDKQLRSIMQKVALQINCKLGGALWALTIPLVS